MVKVLLATNEEQLDNAIAGENGIQLVSSPVYYLEAVLPVAEQQRPDVVVITSWLEGEIDITDIIYRLRMMEMRVIFIAGFLTRDDPIIKKICEYGVYDILFGEVTIGQVINKIFNPTPTSQGLSLIGKLPEHKDHDSKPQKEKRQILKNIFKKERSEQKSSSSIKNDTLRIPDESVIITGTNTEVLTDLIKNTKKSLVLIDVDLSNNLALQLGVSSSILWQHDWRIGLSASPFKVNKKVRYLGIDRELGEDIQERDIRCLKEVVNMYRDKKDQVILNLGYRNDLLPLLKDLDLKLIN